MSISWFANGHCWTLTKMQKITLVALLGVSYFIISANTLWAKTITGISWAIFMLFVAAETGMNILQFSYLTPDDIVIA